MDLPPHFPTNPGGFPPPMAPTSHHQMPSANPLMPIPGSLPIPTTGVGIQQQPTSISGMGMLLNVPHPIAPAPNPSASLAPIPNVSAPILNAPPAQNASVSPTPGIVLPPVLKQEEQEELTELAKSDNGSLSTAKEDLGGEDPKKEWPGGEDSEPEEAFEKPTSKRKPPAVKPLRGIFEITRSFATKLWQCRNCNYADIERDVAFRHLREVHMSSAALTDPQEQLPCSYCPKMYLSKAALVRHIAKHHPEKSHLTGRNEVQGEGSFPCSKCKETFPSQKKAEDHNNICVLTLDCNVCGMPFHKGDTLIHVFKARVRKHQRQCFHRNNATKQDREAVPCPKCGDMFKSQAWMESHLQLCAQQLDCSHCGKTFLRGPGQPFKALKRMIYKHEAVCAERTEEQRAKKFSGKKVCPYCDKRFGHSYSCEKHMLTCPEKKKLITK